MVFINSVAGIIRMTLIGNCFNLFLLSFKIRSAWLTNVRGMIHSYHISHLNSSNPQCKFANNDAEAVLKCLKYSGPKWYVSKPIHKIMEITGKKSSLFPDLFSTSLLNNRCNNNLWLGEQQQMLLVSNFSLFPVWFLVE